MNERSFIKAAGDLMVESTESTPRNTREDILNAARRLFIENGFHGTSMRRIAEEAGVALGGAYNHFASKEDIFVTIFLAHHPYRELIERVNNAKGDDIQSMLHNVAGNLEKVEIASPDQFLALLFVELVEFKGKHVPDFFQLIFPPFVEASQRIFADRDQLRNLPPLILLRALMGLFFSYFMSEWVFGDNLPLEARQNGLHYMVDIYLHGIMKPNLEEAE
jgi:AcrR family transcriptional regulator